MMGFYNDVVLPRLCHMAMRNRHFAPYRRRVLSGTQGEVLEIGIGSGLNLPFYGPHVRAIHGLEPSPQLVRIARRAAEHSAGRVTLIEGSAEAIPFDDKSLDTIVTTWTLCSIPHAGRALAEVRRVLKPGGQLLFVEHGLGPDATVAQWQHRLTPLWSQVSGGCHLDRPIQALIAQAGFDCTHLETGYMKGPKPMTYMYEGRAVPK
ncbi:methyltransferase [Salinisphaera orenii MK-B5]|uniref:Methyltransferase n=2 Tax=Salinisphaera TaxID=180541 RepID=A0A423PY74_9GAMM|nr:class I SAM-dependent methyltransferase [Salinisphaera orenii]ROO30534.1 methyltransferase [Salinisphaera orenii MK-B5]